MGAASRLSLLTLGLASGLSAPICAYEGIIGLNSINPAGTRLDGTHFTVADNRGHDAAGLMGMQPLSMVSALNTVTNQTAANTVFIAQDTVGTGSDSTGHEAGTGTTDLWSRIKLEKKPDVVGRSIGPGRLLPDLSVAIGYNDNVTFENNDPVGSYYTRVKPHLAYIMSDRIRKLAFDYFLDAGYFEGTGGKDDYIDNRLVASFDYNPTSRIFASAFAEYKDSHDDRGQGRAEGGTGITQTTLDEWHQWGGGGKFTYGAQTARGRLEFEAAYLGKRYDTNRLFTFSRERDDLSATGRFFYRVRPKTSLVFEAHTTEHDYTRDLAGIPSLDGTILSFLTGVTWQATYKTTGFAKFGYNIRTFDSDRRDTRDGFNWDIGVDWKPRSYSTVHLATSQSLAETNGTGDAINQSDILLYWQHYWLDRLSTRLDLGYQNSTFDPTGREDDSYLLGARVDYAFRRWMNLGAGFRHSTVDSTDDVFGYDQNLFEINIDIIF